MRAGNVDDGGHHVARWRHFKHGSFVTNALYSERTLRSGIGGRHRMGKTNSRWILNSWSRGRRVVQRSGSNPAPVMGKRPSLYVFFFTWRTQGSWKCRWTTKWGFYKRAGQKSSVCPSPSAPSQWTAPIRNCNGLPTFAWTRRKHANAAWKSYSSRFVLLFKKNTLCIARISHCVFLFCSACR